MSAPLPIPEPVWRDAVALRRDLHAHPELRFNEHRTAATVARILEAAGLDVRTGIAGTGMLAELGRGDRHVVLRADLDALAVTDGKDVPYRSTVDGVAHACGHDVHIAAAVAAAQLCAQRLDLAGRITFLFQPAEEIPFGEVSGAQAMLDAGAFDQHVDAVLGLHCWPNLDVGTVGIDEVIAMAAKDAFRITMRGRGSHAALPSGGRDAILAAAQLVTALHHLPSRRLDPGEQAVVNVGTIQGGRSQSVLADHVELTGTVRTVEESVRRRLRAAVSAAVEGVGVVTGTSGQLEWANEMPAVRNHPALVARAGEVLGRIAPGVPVTLDSPPMTTDDFALFAERVPGLYLKLGVRNRADWPPLHSGDFDVDERAIAYGAAALTGLALDVLARPA